jgi:hypothetical protein
MTNSAGEKKTLPTLPPKRGGPDPPRYIEISFIYIILLYYYIRNIFYYYIIIILLQVTIKFFLKLEIFLCFYT